MRYNHISPENTEFVLVSFEGPDAYSMAGGLGVRMDNLARKLAQTGYITHLFFIGDPALPGEEKAENDLLVLHRWCQWISLSYPGGVYDGEEAKLRDFNDSIPGFILDTIVKPAIDADKIVVVMGEEWQTTEAMCRLSDALYVAGLRDKVIILWNANNTYSFHRINWGRLNVATTITSISRYMKHIMERMGLYPLVIPNGIPGSLLEQVDETLAERFRSMLTADKLLCKVARWDPDKNWMEAVEATARLKALGRKPTLLARGGREPYGKDILQKAHSLGLSITEASQPPSNDNAGYMAALAEAAPADVINIPFSLPLDFLAIMYRAADAVLANSSHEPFGIVGLEAMAAGGAVFTGSTGEDYAIPFVNSIMIETTDPMEIVGYLVYLENSPEHERRMRSVARYTAQYFTWDMAVHNLVSKLENQGRIQGLLESRLISTDSELPAKDMFRMKRPESLRIS
jgi:glycosyltransferase involved in cell wall biosynthesis